VDEQLIPAAEEDILVSVDYTEQLNEIIQNMAVLTDRLDLLYTLALFFFQCCMGIFVCLLLYKAIKILI